MEDMGGCGKTTEGGNDLNECDGADATDADYTDSIDR